MSNPLPEPVSAASVEVPAVPPVPAQPDKKASAQRPFMVAGSAVLLCALAMVALSLLKPAAMQPLMITGIAGLAAVAALLLMVVDKYQARLLRERLLMMEILDEKVVGRATCTSDGKIAYANRAFELLLGPASAELMQDPAWPEKLLAQCFAAKDGGAEEFAKLQQQARQGLASATELMRQDETGTTRCLLIEARPSRQAAGYIGWRVEDITPRMQVREAIKREQERWADFMDHAPAGFFSVNEYGQFVFANATLARWLGTTAQELMSGQIKLHDLMQRTPENSHAYDLLTGGGTYQQGEFVLQGPSGRKFQALIAQSVASGETDGPFRTRAVVHDLTPEREWQAALQESQARFRRFFEESPVGVALVADGGMLAECNPAFLRMLGSTAPEVLAQPLSSFVRAEGVDLSALLQQVSSGQGEAPAAPVEVRVTAAGGRELVFQLYIRKLGSDDVTGAKLMLHFIDLTEQKSLEVRFSQSQKMQAIGQLAGGVAHDFNNLLTAMIGFCDLLLLRHKPGDPSFGDIMQIKQNANRAAGLVRQLLAFSRQQTLQPRVLNLTDVLVDLSNLLRRLIGENIELKLVHARELGLLKADQGQIEQVIINMAVNARDAMNGGGKLTITTSNLSLTAPLRREHEEVPAGDWVVIEVTDTGSGIPPEIVGRIFDPFFSTKEVGKGTGLGLSTCYGIVKQTGGYIFVDSEVGRGTTFSIYLPRHIKTAGEEEAKEKAASQAAQDLTGAGTILLVEDEDAVRMFASRALRNKGYTVLEARHGENALEVLEGHQGRIDLVVSDVMMPGMDGPTMLKHIRDKRPSLKAVFISGYSEERLKETFETSNDIHFLAKPFSLKQLAEKVKEVL